MPPLPHLSERVHRSHPRRQSLIPIILSLGNLSLLGAAPSGDPPPFSDKQERRTRRAPFEYFMRLIRGKVIRAQRASKSARAEGTGILALPSRTNQTKEEREVLTRGSSRRAGRGERPPAVGRQAKVQGRREKEEGEEKAASRFGRDAADKPTSG